MGLIEKFSIQFPRSKLKCFLANEKRKNSKVNLQVSFFIFVRRRTGDSYETSSYRNGSFITLIFHISCSRFSFMQLFYLNSFFIISKWEKYKRHFFFRVRMNLRKGEVSEVSFKGARARDRNVINLVENSGWFFFLLIYDYLDSWWGRK